MRLPFDLTGQKFGALTVKRMVKKWNRTYAECICECGHIVCVKGANLRSGNNTSCGCRTNLSRKLWQGYKGISGNAWNRIRDCAKAKRNPMKSEFTVTIEYAWELFQKQQGKCALSGLPIYLPTTGMEYHQNKKTASFDRIDSTKGYIPGNVQWVHRDINKIKTDFPESRFIELCKAVATCHT